jgi:hypothetical protein
MGRKGRKCVLAGGLGCVPIGHHTQLAAAPLWLWLRLLSLLFLAVWASVPVPPQPCPPIAVCELSLAVFPLSHRLCLVQSPPSSQLA